jgi:hypothetical protein
MSHRGIVDAAFALPPAKRLEIIAAPRDSIGGEDAPLLRPRRPQRAAAG